MSATATRTGPGSPSRSAVTPAPKHHGGARTLKHIISILQRVDEVSSRPTPVDVPDAGSRLVIGALVTGMGLIVIEFDCLRGIRMIGAMAAIVGLSIQCVRSRDGRDFSCDR